MQYVSRLANILYAARQASKQTHTIVVLCTLVAYIPIVLLIRATAYRDPTSFFFRPEVAYDRKYSLVRQHQAEQYILQANVAPPVHRQGTTTGPPEICLGVPSIARDGTSYLPTTIASLLDGLTRHERDGIHLIVFIAVTNPEKHSAYHEPWLRNLADQVLEYDLPDELLKHIMSLESEKGLFREKALFDYTYLLEKCLETKAPYIAMLEDDVLALDGWFHRTRQALDEATRRSAANGFLYLRLFYTEEFLGWNSEHLPIHMAYSLCVIGSSWILLTRARRFSATLRQHLTASVVMLICLGPIPLAILLYFLTGRVTVLPLPTGINVMNNYGCCSQGLVFPRHKAELLKEWYKTKHIGFVDSLTEDYANDHQEQRWALTPSVLQHVGTKSSKIDKVPEEGGKHHKLVAEKLWNFAYEVNDASKLQQEHQYHSRLSADRSML